jgi:hypothetical protein
MQFVEQHADACNGMIAHMRGHGVHCSYTLLPLVSGWEQSFQDGLSRELERYDLIIYDVGNDAAASRIELITQRSVSLDDGEQEWVENEAPTQAFADWWKIPVAGGPRTSVALFRAVVMLYTRRFGGRAILGEKLNARRLRVAEDALDDGDELLLRRTVIDQPDRSITAVLDRLHGAVKGRAIFIAILFTEERLKEAASYLSERHGLRVVESHWLPVREWPSRIEESQSVHSIGELSALLIGGVADRRRRLRIRQQITRALWKGLTGALVIALLVILYFGLTSWSDLYHRPFQE